MEFEGKKKFFTDFDKKLAAEIAEDMYKAGMQVMFDAADCVYTQSKDQRFIDWIENGYRNKVVQVENLLELEIAFMRICSGKFIRDREYYHVQGKKSFRLSQPQQMMASEREVINEAYAGDIIGVFDPGIFSIGDTICEKGRKIQFEGIPTFAPEHFAMVEQVDSMKRKQFSKGMNQIAKLIKIHNVKRCSSCPHTVCKVWNNLGCATLSNRLL